MVVGVTAKPYCQTLRRFITCCGASVWTSSEENLMEWSGRETNALCGLRRHPKRSKSLTSLFCSTETRVASGHQKRLCHPEQVPWSAGNRMFVVCTLGEVESYRPTCNVKQMQASSLPTFHDTICDEERDDCPDVLKRFLTSECLMRYINWRICMYFFPLHDSTPSLPWSNVRPGFLGHNASIMWLHVKALVFWTI